MSRLLDTDLLSEVLKQKHAIVVQKATAYLQAHQRFTFSAFTRYEVVRGLKAKRATRQLKRFVTFCQHSLILPITDDDLDRAADLWATADRTGPRLPGTSTTYSRPTPGPGHTPVNY